ncbi:meteorin-like protein [Clarias gariepinus]
MRRDELDFGVSVAQIGGVKLLSLFFFFLYIYIYILLQDTFFKPCAMRMKVMRALLVACLCSSAVAQYSSDQCSWRGSGLTHESHARDVEQVYLRCSEGSLEWLYPTGAIIVNLRPNTFPEAGAETRLSACVKPRADSRGASVFVERAGVMRMLLSEEEQAAGRVRCFGLDEGALFIQAAAHSDISRRVTAFQYELIRGERATAPGETLSPSDPCRPCTDDEILLAVCTSDFVVRGSIESIMDSTDDEQRVSLSVSVSRLFRQKRRVFKGRGRNRWSGRVSVPRSCAIQVGQGSDSGVGKWAGFEEFLFTGAIRFSEAWLGCAPQYHDFLQMYQSAVESGSNPCHMDVN